MRKGLSASLFAICLATGDLSAGQKPDLDKLARFKEKTRRDIAGISNYTCLETIARERRTPSLKEFRLVDTVRLEVSMVAGKELFAKPGHGFDDRSVTSFVNSGAIGSGMFSALVRNLFASGRGTLRYVRDENLNGHRAVHYDFHLTRDESDFQFQVGDVSQMVAAKGSFWFDPVSLDLIRLEVHGQDIPSSLPIDEASVRIDYAHARIGASDASLPKRSELTMHLLTGVAFRDVIEFSQCHEYHAESTIAFGNDTPQVRPAPDNPQPAVASSTSSPSTPSPAPDLILLPSVEVVQPPDSPVPLPPPVTAPIAPPSEPPRDDQVSFKSQANLVMVPVVVRDRKGNAIGGLRKEDFQLFDKNRRQEITDFRVQQTAIGTVQSATGSTQPKAERQLEKTRATVVPEHFVAFVFDDVHLRFEDVVSVRDAAKRYIASSLAPGDRTAVVTTSGNSMLDFTDDRAKLLGEMQRLQPRTVAKAGGGKRCPDISFYDADRLDRESNPNGGPALDAATYEVLACFPNFQLAQAQQIAIQVARDEWTSGRFESRAALRVLRTLVQRMAVMPGERTIVLVSPGFHLLTEHHTDEMGLVDLALRSHVVINALDARGLFEINPGGEIDDRPQQIDSKKTIEGMERMRKARYQSRVTEAETSAEVMADLASGTGGRLIENSNDYDGALRRLASAPEYVYILGFSPPDLKSDGSFHPLKVHVTAPGKLDAQARRGYYAPQAKVVAEQIVRQSIEDAVFSREEIKAFPLELHTQVADAKIDVEARFQGKADQGDLTVVAALFDGDGVFVMAHQNVIHAVNGLSEVKTEFDANEGSYLVRIVIASAAAQVPAASNCPAVIRSK
jgi:VWFA-related protein